MTQKIIKVSKLNTECYHLNIKKTNHQKAKIKAKEVMSREWFIDHIPSTIKLYDPSNRGRANWKTHFIEKKNKKKVNNEKLYILLTQINELIGI